MAAKWIEALTGSLEQKKQYKNAKGRIDALPEPHRTAAAAMHRYLLYYGGVTDADTHPHLFVDPPDLWERAAIDGIPVGEITGDDPVDFTETFAQSYAGTRWIDKERARLAEAIETARREEGEPS